MTIHIFKISWRAFKERIKEKWIQLTNKEPPNTEGIF
jgi:predicted phosphohydrolase